MQIISSLTCIILLLSLGQLSSSSAAAITLQTVERCLSNLTTHELADSYNYLQLSLKLGATQAYPGFSSLFMKLSDDHVSKAHDITKFLVLRKSQLNRLIFTEGVKIRDGIADVNDTSDSLKEARQQNEKTWNIVKRCHRLANHINDAHIQDYLESHLLEHHIELDKLFEDFHHRIHDAQETDKELLTFMLDEELLNTYGDRRKDIFS